MEINERSNQKFIADLSVLKGEEGITEKDYCLTGLIDYVTKLQEWMKQKPTLEILKYLPSTGKLLSKALKINRYLQNDILGELLLECILSLSNLPRSFGNASSNAERKVGQWAAEQLQFLTLPEISQDDATFMEQFGITQKDSIKSQIDEIFAAMMDGNFRIHSSIQSKLIDNLLTMTRIMESDEAEHLLKNVVECVLQILERKVYFFCKESKQFKQAIPEEFLQAIVSNEMFLKGLSDSSFIKLWQCYLPAFEREVLDLVKVIEGRPYIDDTSVAKLVEARTALIRACAEDVSFYDCTCDLMRESLQCIGCLPSMISLVKILNFRVVQFQAENHLPKFDNFNRRHVWCVPFCKDLNVKTIEATVKYFVDDSRIFFESEAANGMDIWFKLVQNAHLIEYSIQLVFQGDHHCIDNCLTILTWFFFQKNDMKIMKIFKSFLMSLRCLLHKKILQISDISYAIDLCKKRIPDNANPMPFIRDLMLEFFIQADASYFILRDAFSMVTSDLSYEMKLDVWLRVLERRVVDPQSTNSNCFKELNFCEEKKRTFAIFMACLLDRMMTSSGGDMNMETETLDSNKDMLNDLIRRVNVVTEIIKGTIDFVS